MELKRAEFLAMNNPIRRFIQKHLEYKKFQKLGLVDEGRDILEIGCGSGYGAVLLLRLKPKSYAGIDLMPEQIRLADRRGLANSEFRVMDAAYMSFFQNATKDIVVIFGILHHVPEWRKVLAECYRVLRPGGSIFVEEPDGGFLKRWDRVFKWNHPDMANFTSQEFEEGLSGSGFSIIKRDSFAFMRIWSARKDT